MLEPQLQKMLEKEAVPQTLLFVAAPQAAKEAALAFAVSLMGEPHAKKIEKGIHPDLHVYQPEGKSGMHPMASMQQLIQEAQFPPFEAPIKVFIIEEAEKMLPSSSNALLKTLEEPLAANYFILLSQEMEKLLPTIVSRSCVISFSTPLEKIETLPFLFPKTYPEVLEALGALNKEEAGEKCLQDILFWYRDRHLLAQGGNPAYLYHQDHFTELRAAAQTPLPPLEKVLELVERGGSALQHHVKLRTILEDFYLTLMS